MALLSEFHRMFLDSVGFCMLTVIVLSVLLGRVLKQGTTAHTIAVISIVVVVSGAYAAKTVSRNEGESPLW